MKSILFFWIDRIPNWVLRLFVRRPLIVTLHHMVSDDSPPHIRQIYAHKTIAAFEADLDYIQSNHEIVSYKDSERSPSSRTPKAILSFDDGLREHFDVIRPILIRRKLPAIFFVTTDWTDNNMLGPRHAQSLLVDTWLNTAEDERQAVTDRINRVLGESTVMPTTLPDHIARKFGTAHAVPWDELLDAVGISEQKYLQSANPYLTRQQIVQMAAEGFTIGAHSKSHRKFSSINDQGDWKNELAESCDKIAEITGQTIVPFAFPHSGANVPISFMKQIQSEFDHVGMLFDTNGIASNTPVVVGRVTLDQPDLDAPSSAGTAEQQINSAYRTEAKRSFKRILRVFT